MLAGTVAVKFFVTGIFFLILQTPAKHGHLIITDSLHCPWGKKALTFPLHSTWGVLKTKTPKTSD